MDNTQLKVITDDVNDQQIDNVLWSQMHEAFIAQKQKSIVLRSSTAAERIIKLTRLRDAIHAHRDEIHQALCADLPNRPTLEIDITEIMLSVQEANMAIRKLKSWMKPQRVPTSLALLGTFSHVHYEPMGVNLIIAPWNFPFNLTMMPLVSAVAAGNTAIIKPSEFTPATGRVVAKIIGEVFAADEVICFEGDAKVAEALLKLPFDHIFFTGSPAVGKIVMTAAAKNLTKVTLELGGKSPVIVDSSANIHSAARSILLGKHQNAGQACIAPDHLYVHQSVADELFIELRAGLEDFLGTSEQQHSSPDYSRIVSVRHATRLKMLLDDAVTRGGKIVAGGTALPQEQYIQPTILRDVPIDATIMQEEIFGPLLPVIIYQDLSEVIDRINTAPKPLALYIYAKNQRIIDQIISQTSSGATGINICVFHYAEHQLPFGGVSNSGMGRAHGHEGFKGFSNPRGIIRDRFATLALFAPPYRPWLTWLARFLARWL